MNSFLRVIWNSLFNLTGLDISFDTKYKDWSFYLIELKANYQVVKKMLAEKHLIPKEIAPGETRLQIIGCEMRRVQNVGSYHEVSIQVSAEPFDESPGEKFVHLFLPVTTEAARWGGVDIYGFPKFIANIDFEKDEDQTTCRLTANKELILEFRMDDKVGTKKQFIWEFYGNRKHQIIKTTFSLEGLILEEESKQNVNLTLGTHEIADTLRELLLSDEVMLTVIGHNLSGILKKPVRIKSIVKAN